ncbi:MAG: DUF222 domain-containing protein [Mycobacterium sp.]
MLTASAAAQRSGALNTEHAQVIRSFWHQLPGWVDTATREQAEAALAGHATGTRPRPAAGQLPAPPRKTAAQRRSPRRTGRRSSASAPVMVSPCVCWSPVAPGSSAQTSCTAR